MFRRYAVFHTCPPGALADFGAAWLGWDSATGRDGPHAAVAGLPAPVAELVATPQRYGFHGTVKPPFRLAPGATPAALAAALRDLCAAHPPAVLDGLTLTATDGFAALVPRGDTAALDRIAADVVRDLDRFRAPPTPAEIARRQPDRLTDRQRAHLRRWGYPFVMDDFRFHLTLTGQLGPADAVQVLAALLPLVAPLAAGPFRIDALTLMGEDAAGRFRQIDRIALSG